MSPNRLIPVVAALTATALLTGCGGTRKTAVAEVESVSPELTLTQGQLAEASGEPVQLTFDDSNNGIATYSPDGRRIVFQSDRDGRWQIYELNLDDMSIQRLVTSESNDENPVWMSDMTELLYVTDRNSGGSEWSRDIAIFHFGDGSTSDLTSESADDWFPVSLAGSEFLFLSDRGSPESGQNSSTAKALYIGTTDGASVRRISPPSLDPSSPASLDGDRYLLRSKSGQLGILNTKTSEYQLITSETVKFGTTCWNPVRGLIATTVFNGQVYTLNLFDPVKKVIQQLEVGDGEIRYPQFSPDGNRILYTKEVEGKFQLFELSLAQ